MPDVGFIKQQVVEITDEGVVRDTFPLTEEIESVEWMPGVIVLLPADQLEEIKNTGMILKNIPVFQINPSNILNQSSRCFEESLKDAKKGDFIYFDPPYDSDTSTFNSYTENGFGKEEQERLSEVFKDLDKRGCYVMLSNYNTSLIKELYKDYNFNYIEAQRNIGAKAKDRGIVEEVIITNFKNKEGFSE